MTTWPDTAWGQLRATRWQPPGAAARDAQRSLTYVSALEQAEQLFRAAVGVGPAAQPILLFYGLSQAGRAIAAAATAANDSGWQLQGHGIHTVPATIGGPLADIQVRSEAPGKSGSFVRLSALLDSPLLPTSPPATLATLWDAIPENRTAPIGSNDRTQRTPLLAEVRDIYGEPHPLATVPVAYFPPWLLASARDRKALDSYLTSFPEAQDYHSYYRTGREPESAPEFTEHADGWAELNMNWELPGGHAGTAAERTAMMTAKTRLYHGQHYFFPALSGTTRSIHPLMTWWAVLHTLSMLARYQPAQWSSYTNVNANPHAVPLENLLNAATHTVPTLIAEAINQAATQPRSET